MPVTIGASSGTRRFFTGLIMARIKAINPTKEELNNIFGIPANDEPKYNYDGTTKAGAPVKKTRLELHFESIKSGIVPADVRARLSLFTSYAYVTGMQKNNFGRFTSNTPEQEAAEVAESIAKGKERPNFYSSTWQQKVFDGEMDLMLVLEALLNPKKGTDFFMEDIANLIHNGDTREVQEFLALANSKNRYVQILLGVQTDSQGRHYQTCFKKVCADWVNKYDSFHGQLLKNLPYSTDTYFGPLEANYTADSYRFREWFPPGEEPQQEEPTETETSYVITPAGAAAAAIPPAPGAPTAPAAPAAPHNPIAAAEADGWIHHPTSPEYHYRGQEVLLSTEVAAKYPAPAPVAPAAPAPPRPAAPAPPTPGGPLAAAAAARSFPPVFGKRGQIVKWAPNDTESGVTDPDSDDYNPNKLPF